MESKRLNLASTVVRTVLTPHQSGDVEVPAGEAHFHIEQHENEAAEYVFHLRHPGTQLLVTGLVDARNTATPRLSTTMVHHAQDTKAETIVRTLSQDAAHPDYAGLIKIEENAQHCESYLNHHALLIGEEAQSTTLPSLEILANEVKCSHAATVRTITDSDLFYLRSRGIPVSEARQTLIEAFLHDVQN